jgi:selenide,water dikinase
MVRRHRIAASVASHARAASRTKPPPSLQRDPGVKRLLLVGGGHAHIEVLRRFAESPVLDAEVTLASPHRHTPYSGMLPGLIAGHYTFDEAHIDLAPLAARARAVFVQSRVVSLDASARIARCEDGTEHAFDVAGIDVGSTPDMSVPGAREHTIGVKPVDRFLARWREAMSTRPHAPVRIVVVGGGAGGVELVMALKTSVDAQRGDAADARRDEAEFRLLTDTPSILPTHAPAVRRRVEAALTRRNIAVDAGRRVTRVDAGALACDDGAVVRADVIVWATSASAAPWVRESGLAVDPKGFMLVDRHLESTSHPRIFGSGDIASLAGMRIPKSGVFAVRKGPVLARNIRAALGGGAMSLFVTKPSALALITTGGRSAVMSWGRFALEGEWVWRWKDWIDRRFMEKYRARS